MSRNLIVFSMLVFAGGFAGAAVQLLQNGGFDAEPWAAQFNEGTQNYPQGWSGWGSSGWHVTPGNPNDAPYILGDKAITIYYGDTGVHQPIAASEGDFFIFTGQMNHPTTDPYGEGGPLGGALSLYRHGILRIEFWTGPWDPNPAQSGVLIESVEIGRTNGNDPGETWFEFTGGAQAPAATGEVRFVATVYDEPGEVVDGKLYFDDLAAFAPGPRQANNPVPSYDAAVGVDLDILSWTAPEPNEPGDTVVCDVWLSADEPNFVASNPNAAKFTDKAESVSLSGEGFAVKEDTTYFWRVDCRDPSVGTTEGMVWTFNTGDTPPTVNAGVDRYVWLDMDDGDGDDTKVTVTLSGVVDDDGKSPVTTEWTLNYSETAEGTNVIIDNAAEPLTTVSIDNTGWFQFLLTADDDFGHGENIVHVGVYSSACQAAMEDPSDRYNSYPDGLTGDVNSDCETNLEDLAIVASTWLDCMSDKLGCQL